MLCEVLESFDTFQYCSLRLCPRNFLSSRRVYFCSMAQLTRNEKLKWNKIPFGNDTFWPVRSILHARKREVAVTVIFLLFLPWSRDSFRAHHTSPQTSGFLNQAHKNHKIFGACGGQKTAHFDQILSNSVDKTLTTLDCPPEKLINYLFIVPSLKCSPSLKC